LGDGIACIVDSFEGYYAGPLRTTIWSNVDIGAKDGAGMGSLAEEIF
jgi:hypothetical protein